MGGGVRPPTVAPKSAANDSCGVVPLQESFLFRVDPSPQVWRARRAGRKKDPMDQGYASIVRFSLGRPAPTGLSATVVPWPSAAARVPVGVASSPSPAEDRPGW